MNVTYGKGFLPATDMRERVDRLQAELAQLEQYVPVTKNTFHGGMLCREVWRDADTLVVGKVHKHEHFYMVVSGTLVVTTDEGVERITGPQLVLSKAGTKRAVYSETATHTITFHRTDATTVEDAEKELLEPDETARFDAHNKLKLEVLT